jgi:hypothetical protein
MLNSLVSLLPVAWQDKAKGIVGVFGAVVFVVVSTLSSVPHWVDVVVAVLTALGVYAAPNLGYEDPSAPKPQIPGKA